MFNWLAPGVIGVNESSILDLEAMKRGAEAFMTPEKERTPFQQILATVYTKEEQQAINVVFASDFVAAAETIWESTKFLVHANIQIQTTATSDISVKVDIMRQTRSSSVAKIRLLENEARKRTQTLIAMHLGDEAAKLNETSNHYASHLPEFEISMANAEGAMKKMIEEFFGQDSVQDLFDVCNQSLNDIVAAAIKAGPLGEIALNELTCVGHQLLRRPCSSPECLALRLLSSEDDDEGEE